MQLINVTNSRNDTELVLESFIQQDDITNKISNAFDYKFDGKINTTIKIPQFPKEFKIGLILGSSGSGKSTLLNHFGKSEQIFWDNSKCIASNFNSFEEASNKFGAVGLNSIPTWLKPYNVLSTGEKFRADMARSLKNNAIIDEFTSVINRECAISCSVSISKYIKSNNLHNIVFASCHDDIIEYLQPDWIYDTDKKEFRGSVRQRPSIILEVNQCSKQIWSMFKQYHYLSADLNTASDCYLFSYNKLPVAFAAILSMPGKFGCDTRNCVSEHRIVVLPDFQGMGIGNKISEYLGELYLFNGYRYFGKTANPRMGNHREHSSLWKATSSNLKVRLKNISNIDELSDVQRKSIRLKPRPIGRNTSEQSILNTLTRLCYSHEYIGNENTKINNNRKNNTLFVL